MMPNVVRGSNAVGLMQYLAGGGRANEHRDQHLVAGDSTTTMTYGFGPLTPELATQIGRDLEEPWRLFGTQVMVPVYAYDDSTGERTRVGSEEKHMWHTSLSLRAEEGELTDEEWGAIANDFVGRMGFTESSGKAACRWVAVRHGLSKNGNDHIHIAVSLVREDGTKASTHNDFARAQKVCRELEQEHGLQGLEAREAGRGARGEKPAERARAERDATPDVAAKRLETVVRSAAVMAEDEAGFVRLVRDAGVMIRPRYATGRTDVVVGFSVAERPTGGMSPVWFGGGRLARDLTLPRLREGWPDSPTAAQDAVDEWRRGNSAWTPSRPPRTPIAPDPNQMLTQLQDAADRLASISLDDTSAWAHAARDASGVLFTWSRRTEQGRGPLADAGRVLARSAHIRADVSKPKPAGMGSLSNVALMLAASDSKSSAATDQLMLRQLMRFGSSLASMHAARGEMQRAAELASAMQHTLQAVASPAGMGGSAPSPWIAANEPVHAETSRPAPEAPAARDVQEASLWAATANPALFEFVDNTRRWASDRDAIAAAEQHLVNEWRGAVAAADAPPASAQPIPSQPVRNLDFPLPPSAAVRARPATENDSKPKRPRTDRDAGRDVER